jgi:hypothetical protein
VTEHTIEEMGEAINDCFNPLHKEAVWRMACCVEGIAEFSKALFPPISLNHPKATPEELYAKALKYVDTAVPYAVLQIDYYATRPSYVETEDD